MEIDRANLADGKATFGRAYLSNVLKTFYGASGINLLYTINCLCNRAIGIVAMCERTGVC